MNIKKIAIVGGGLAGLTAAYRLLKEGHKEVHLFESQPYLGGRVQSRKVRGYNIDFGGFLIYPWYKKSHQLFEELSLEKRLIKVPLSDIYYYLGKDAVGLKEGDIPFSKKDELEIWVKSILKILPSAELSNPNLELFKGSTISEYLRETLGTLGNAGLYETFFDTVVQGYCYGPINKTKAAFMEPIVREVTLHGDIRTTSFFPQGIQTLTDRLAQEITSLGGSIHLNSPIIDVEKLTLRTEKEVIKNDAIVFAQTVSEDLYRKILPGIKADCWYTHFVTVAVELSAIPIVGSTQEWGAAFYVPNEAMPRQVLSIINLSSLYGPKLTSCLMLNIIIRDHIDSSFTVEDIKSICDKEVQRIFPNSGVVKIIDYMHWKKTMPVSQEAFVEAVRKHQGQDGYYFAGDFLGAPSIEVAIETGSNAAQLLLEKEVAKAD